MTLDEAQAEASQIARSLQGIKLRGDLRSRVAFACFAIAQQHHAAILTLLANSPPLHATAFALLRLLVEATLRGQWISHCATDEDVKCFVSGDKQQLAMSSLVRALEKQLGDLNVHEVLYKKIWSVLSAYTHTYEHQILHWLNGNDVSSDYSPEQVQWLISTASPLLKLCEVSVRGLSIGAEP